MMSTKNSQGLPMAFWKDWRLPVSSGGTALSSRTGGAPGGPLLASPLEPTLGRLYRGGSPGGPYEGWLWWLLSLAEPWLRWLSWLRGRSRRAAGSDSLPLPPDLRSFSLPAALLLLSLVLRLEPLLLLPDAPAEGRGNRREKQG